MLFLCGVCVTCVDRPIYTVGCCKVGLFRLDVFAHIRFLCTFETPQDYTPPDSTSRLFDSTTASRIYFDDCRWPNMMTIKRRWRCWRVNVLFAIITHSYIYIYSTYIYNTGNWCDNICIYHLDWNERPVSREDSRMVMRTFTGRSYTKKWFQAICKCGFKYLSELQNHLITKYNWH